MGTACVSMLQQVLSPDSHTSCNLLADSCVAFLRTQLSTLPHQVCTCMLSIASPPLCSFPFAPLTHRPCILIVAKVDAGQAAHPAQAVRQGASAVLSSQTMGTGNGRA